MKDQGATRYRQYSFSWYLIKYVWNEVFSSFLIGTAIFLFIMLLFQAIRLSEFIISQQVSFYRVGLLCYYLMLSFLPIAIPIAFLFAVLMGISRANSEGEILAFQVNGLSLSQVYRPILTGSILLSLFCLYIALYTVPQGNRGFELLITQISSERIMSRLKPGVFMENFFGLTLFTERISTVKSEMRNVFVYDERDETHPVAITADVGVLRPFPDKGLVILRLTDGSIYVDKPTPGGIQQKINFEVYDINLTFDKGGNAWREYSLPSLTYPQIQNRMEQSEPDSLGLRHLEVELHRRFSMAFACIVFGALGFFIGTFSVKGVRSSAVLLCLAVGVVYWLSYIAANALAVGGRVPPWLGIWLPNVIFMMVPWVGKNGLRRLFRVS